MQKKSPFLNEMDTISRAYRRRHDSQPLMKDCINGCALDLIPASDGFPADRHVRIR
jgi:hypothetical protein